MEGDLCVGALCKLFATGTRWVFPQDDALMINWNRQQIPGVWTLGFYYLCRQNAFAERPLCKVAFIATLARPTAFARSLRYRQPIHCWELIHLTINFLQGVGVRHPRIYDRIIRFRVIFQTPQTLQRELHTPFFIVIFIFHPFFVWVDKIFLPFRYFPPSPLERGWASPKGKMKMFPNLWMELLKVWVRTGYKLSVVQVC